MNFLTVVGSQITWNWGGHWICDYPFRGLALVLMRYQFSSCSTTSIVVNFAESSDVISRQRSPVQWVDMGRTIWLRTQLSWQLGGNNIAVFMKVNLLCEWSLTTDHTQELVEITNSEIKHNDFMCFWKSFVEGVTGRLSCSVQSCENIYHCLWIAFDIGGALGNSNKKQVLVLYSRCNWYF